MNVDTSVYHPDYYRIIERVSNGWLFKKGELFYTTLPFAVDREDWRLEIADSFWYKPSTKVGGINLKSSISNPQAASLVGVVNLKSTIGNLQLFDMSDLELLYGISKQEVAVNLRKINGGEAGYYLADLRQKKYYYCGAEVEGVKTKLRSLGIGRDDPME